MGSKGGGGAPGLPQQQDSGMDPMMMQMMMGMMQNQNSQNQMPQMPQQREAPVPTTPDPVDWHDTMREVQEKAGADYQTDLQDRGTRMSTMMSPTDEDDYLTTGSLLSDA